MNANSTTFNILGRTETIARRYEQVCFHGTLKPRDGDARLGRLKLDSANALNLGINNIGLFIECSPCFDRLVEHLADLNDCNRGKWIVVASSKQVASSLIQAQENMLVEGHAFNNIAITTPEKLATVKDDIHGDDAVAAILIIDFACHIHKCRGFSNGRFQVPHDRPQKIVDFRNSLRVGEWSPPLMFITNKRAISVNTQPMLSPYCLEAFCYIDGRTMRFGEIQARSEANAKNRISYLS